MSQEPSESLFDTNFTNEQQQQQQQQEQQQQSQQQQQPAHQDSLEAPQDAADILPSLDTPNEAIIGYRILVSIKEAGIIIGKEGSVISSIRELTGVKAAISPVILTCPDRILSITGALESVSQALALVAQALRNSPLDYSTFLAFPLKRLSINDDPQVQSLRLLIPNAQMGTIIGKQGSRIKSLQSEYGVKITASKDFLYDSTERLVEVQGTPDQIEQVLGVLSRCLLEDWHNGTGTSFYVPTPRTNPRYHGNNNTNNSNNTNNNSNNNNNSINGGATSSGAGSATANTANGSKFKNAITKKIKYPSDMVGCLIGKEGSRIQEIRKVTGTQIVIDSKDDENDERLFELVGAPKNVERAIGYLNHNLEKERERRERLANE